MRQIYDFYNDSKTKSKTRELLIINSLELFSTNGIDGISLGRIAEACDITTRNLYRYYPSKEYLVIDCAYHSFLRLNEYSHDIESINLTGIEYLKKLMLRMLHLKKNREDELNFIKFIMYFDIYIATLEKSHPAFVKYTEKYVPQIDEVNKTDIITALEKGIKDKTINIKNSEIALYDEYIVQSLFSINMRIIIKEYENRSINSSLADKHIEIILDHLGVKT